MKRLFIDTIERLAQVVADERREAHLTQLELASRAGVSRRFIIELEKGHPRAELSRVLAVLHALDVRPYAIPPTRSDVDPHEIDLDAVLAEYQNGR
ncbi:helix-turn-helix domain-containing protein [Tessaracoccus caeni]|uniref:helix-turn-helix domain-containing protein n=1 Tax=Tessaracoccus caeni TaxID=3031239 RepID=UPI0023DAEE8A|nr:helix-turn-helix domain-containing protein [Tessaracoccus caeni]MDF1488524.1 helix-turn-helix domain-containing protein [Tessaracoccus caeni]